MQNGSSASIFLIRGHFHEDIAALDRRSFLLAVAAAQPSFQPAPALTLPLREGWTLQSSAKVTETGEAISSASFQTRDWIQADVPTTVVAAQVKSGLLPDPFYGMNLRQYPGVSYPIGFNFSNVPMPPDSPYAVSWWYRKEFTLPACVSLGKRCG